jgi:glycerol-3-phosphate acyltransferase PlsY
LIPVLLAFAFGFDIAVVAVVGIAAFLGHVFPVFLRFRGGKGVATAFGVFLGIAPLAALVLMAVFAVVFLTSRMVSLSSMITAAAAPITLWLASYPAVFVAAGLFLAVVVIIRHHENIRRLIAGTEPKFES